MCSPSLKAIIEKSRAAEGVGSPGSYKNINFKYMFWYKFNKKVDAVKNNIFEHVCSRTTTTIIIYFLLVAVYYSSFPTITCY